MNEKLNTIRFQDLLLQKLYTVPVSEHLLDLVPLKILHFAIKSRSPSRDLLAVCSFGDILNHLHSGSLEDKVENILGLDVDNENYLVYYCEEGDQVIDACKKFAVGLHRAVVESVHGFYLATQMDILKALLEEEIFKLTIKQFFKSRSEVELKYIKSGTSLQDALGSMKKSNLPCLPVLDDGKLVGCLCPLAVPRIDPKNFKNQLSESVDLLVSGLASKTLTENDTIRTAIEMMLNSGDSRVFITRSDKVVGVVSASDILKVLVE